VLEKEKDNRVRDVMEKEKDKENLPIQALSSSLASQPTIIPILNYQGEYALNLVQCHFCLFEITFLLTFL